MAGYLAVFVDDRRQRQGVAGAKPCDGPTLSLVAVGVIDECGGDDLIDFVFVAWFVRRGSSWSSSCTVWFANSGTDQRGAGPRRGEIPGRRIGLEPLPVVGSVSGDLVRGRLSQGVQECPHLAPSGSRSGPRYSSSFTLAVKVKIANSVRPLFSVFSFVAITGRSW